MLPSRQQLTSDHEPACMCHLYRLRINTHVLTLTIPCFIAQQHLESLWQSEKAKNKNAFQSKAYHRVTHRLQKHFKQVHIIVIRNWYGLDIKWHWPFEKAFVKHKHVVELCELWKLIHLTLTLIQQPWYSNLTSIL